MDKIKKIKIRGKIFFIMFQELGFDLECKLLKSSRWVSAYVYLENKRRRNLFYETYREGNVIGIDTGHYWNWEMTLEEKYKDAERQITELIKDYLERV